MMAADFAAASDKKTAGVWPAVRMLQSDRFAEAEIS